MEQFSNGPNTTLAAAITSTSATSITVSSSTAFPVAETSGSLSILS